MHEQACHRLRKLDNMTLQLHGVHERVVESVKCNVQTSALESANKPE